MEKICSACGKEVEEALETCPYCGAALSAEAEAERIRRIAEAAAEEERRIIAQRKAERAAAARKKNIIIAVAAVLTLALAVVLIINNVVIPNNVYKQAEALRTEGKYLEAMELYYSQPGQKGCKARIDEFEDMLWVALSGITWEDGEHVYNPGFKTGGKSYDVALLHKLQFDSVTRLCGASKAFRYYKAGTRNLEYGKGDTYESTVQIGFQVEDGKVYLYGVRDFGKILLKGTIQEGHAVVESLTGTVELSNESQNYETTFLPY